MVKEDRLSKLFGIDRATLDKSKDIKPILDLSKLEENETIVVTFLDKEPHIIETPNSKFSKTARIISVKDENNLEYSLFLSAKSLSLGVGKLWESNNNDLTNVRAIIKKTTAIYKEFGENTAYNIQEMK